MIDFFISHRGLTPAAVTLNPLYAITGLVGGAGLSAPGFSNNSMLKRTIIEYCEGRFSNKMQLEIANKYYS
jgi:hypothetical protein